MGDLLPSLAALGWSLPLLGVVCALSLPPRRILALLGAALALTLAAGAAVGALVLPGDLVLLPGWTGLSEALLLLVLWATFGALAGTAGRCWMPGSPLLGAAVAGALLGEVAGSLLCAAGVEAPKDRARLALAASAGGLCGRLGDPTLLLLAARRPDMLVVLVPLALLCVLVAFPGGRLPSAAQGRVDVSVLGLLTAAGVALSGAHAGPVLAAGCVGMAILVRDRLRAVDWTLPVRAVLVGALLTLAAAGGLPELAALQLESGQELLGPWLKPLVAGTAALVAALLDSQGAALFAEALVARGLSLTRPGLIETLAAGAAIGGLTPLVVAGPGTLRAGVPRWLMQVAIVMFWAGFVL